MCGFSAILSTDKCLSDYDQVVGCMLDSIAHRGPDDSAIKNLGNAILGHRRLSIIDLEAGPQPIQDEAGRYFMVFNGEIYNYIELREELERNGEFFSSNTDTEVLFRALIRFGVEAVPRLNGMFSFLFYDKLTQSWIAARDHFGIKPLYFSQLQGEIVFGSEIKALLLHPDLQVKRNKEAFGDYLTFQFCFGEKTLFDNITKVQPGHYLVGTGHRVEKNCCYWDNEYHLDEWHTEKYFEEKLLELLEDTIRLQTRSDVPVGAYLSGGLDSSLVSSLAAQRIDGSLHVFHGRFAEGLEFDESRYAKIMAESIGADFNEIVPSAEDFVNSMPSLIYALDEPVAGPGVFPQFMVSKLASEKVKVILGGQGGDEIFAGYTRYLVAYFEQVLKGAINGTNKDGKHLVTLESIVPNLSLMQQYVPMMKHLFASGLFGEMDQRYFRLVDRGQNNIGDLGELANYYLSRYRAFDEFQKVFNKPDTDSYINKMTYFDQKTLLPGLLHIEDRVSMHASIESRVPLLDRRIVELVSKMPPSFKFQGGEPKAVLKKATQALVPSEVAKRKDKMGFPVPLAQWLNQKLVHEFVGDLLLSKRSLERGMFQKKALVRMIDEPGLAARQIWGALCLELWHVQFLDK